MAKETFIGVEKAYKNLIHKKESIRQKNLSGELKIKDAMRRIMRLNISDYILYKATKRISDRLLRGDKRLIMKDIK